MKVAVTGAASDFATAILPRLFEDGEIDQVVAVDLNEPRVDDPKMAFEREDVRSPRMRELFDGADAVVHLAYVVREIRDKRRAHDVNIGGSRNVIGCAQEAGVKRLVLASSVAAYGAHTDFPQFVTEDEYPRGSPDKYYFYDKAQVENYVEWWKRLHPDAKMEVTLLRPPVVVGPTLHNAMLSMWTSAVLAIPSELGPIQFLFESDLVDAFYRAVKEGAGGPLNLGTDDFLNIEEIASISGQKLIRGPVGLFERIAGTGYRLGLSPVSSHWVTQGPPVVSNKRARSELGWAPQYSTVESAYIHLIQSGRPILGPDVPGGGVARVFSRKDVAEAALKPSTEQLGSWAESVSGLKRAVGGEGEIERMAQRVEHEFIPYKGKAVHLEVHVSDDPEGPTVVFSPGLGAYARFYLPLLGKLCDEGMNVIGIDRPGHGLSEGRRGDVSLGAILDVVEEAVRYGRERFSGPVVLAGSSLGGIITWLALTREIDVDAALCHNIAHPQVFHEPSMKVKVPLLRRLARIAPHAPIPIKQLADFGAVTDEPEILDSFEREVDRIFTWTVCVRAVAEMFEYVPPVDWSEVEIPTLILVGEEDKMVTSEFTRTVLERSSPPNTEMKLLPEMGHLIFHDYLDRTLPVFTDFVREHASSPVGLSA